MPPQWLGSNNKKPGRHCMWAPAELKYLQTDGGREQWWLKHLPYMAVWTQIFFVLVGWADYLSAVVDPLQDGGEVGPVFRAVLPTLGHDPVAAGWEGKLLSAGCVRGLKGFCLGLIHLLLAVLRFINHTQCRVCQEHLQRAETDGKQLGTGCVIILSHWWWTMPSLHNINWLHLDHNASIIQYTLIKTHDSAWIQWKLNCNLFNRNAIKWNQVTHTGPAQLLGGSIRPPLVTNSSTSWLVLQG